MAPPWESRRILRMRKSPIAFGTRRPEAIVRVREFCGALFSRLERADDRCASDGLHREHSWALFPDPAQGLHFVECFPHTNEAGAAAGGIKNHVGQLPVALLR